MLASAMMDRTQPPPPPGKTVEIKILSKKNRAFAYQGLFDHCSNTDCEAAARSTERAFREEGEEDAPPTCSLCGSRWVRAIEASYDEETDKTNNKKWKRFCNWSQNLMSKVTTKYSTLEMPSGEDTCLSVNDGKPGKTLTVYDEDFPGKEQVEYVRFSFADGVNTKSYQYQIRLEYLDNHNSMQ